MSIITISREFGSGGREIGKRLADSLKFAYYDREIITAIAEKCSLDKKYIERILEGATRPHIPITFSRTFSRMSAISMQTTALLVQQKEVIRELAMQDNCVIVGRGADIILEDVSPFKLFVCADIQSKIERCRLRASSDEVLTDRELLKKIKQVDKSRADYHSLISATVWGDVHNYHLCINTTEMEIKKLIPFLSTYISEWFKGV